MLMWIAAIVLVLLVAAQAYVRLSPVNGQDWHVPPQVTRDETLENGVRRVLPGGPEDFARLDRIIRATPRTTAVAGSVDEGMVTYVTRTLFWGFPDYTTVRLAEGRIEIFGRARFGRSDLGVNRKRVDGWLSALERDG